MNWNRDNFCLDFDSKNIQCETIVIVIICIVTTLWFFKARSNLKIFKSWENFKLGWLDFNRKFEIYELIPNSADRKKFFLGIDNAVRLLIEEEVPQNKWDFIHGRAAELYKFPKPKKQILVAVHEAGHVLSLWFSKHPRSKVLKVSIIPNSESYGRMTPARGYGYPITAEECFLEMCVHLAGTLAHSIFFPSETQRVKRTGKDFKRFSACAKTLGYTQYVNLKDKKNRSEWEFICFYLRHCFIATLTLIKAHEKDLVEIVKQLLEHDVLNFKQLCEILGDPPKEGNSLYEEFVLKPQPERLKTTIEDMLQSVHEIEGEDASDPGNIGDIFSRMADSVAKKSKKNVLEKETGYDVYFTGQEDPKEMEQWRVKFVKKALKGKKLNEEDFLKWLIENQKENIPDPGYQRLGSPLND